ncbi:hypothetical protein K2Q16_01960 [Patescibacteria group bacterium]|nr:hypothetical protein [Patescibacteria group bacterium]
MREKFKLILADDRLYMACLVVLVALASFALGRHSNAPVGALWGNGGGSGGSAAVSMAYTDTAPREMGETNELPGGSLASTTGPNSPESVPGTGPYVASRSGKKYHHESCGGAKQIKPENKLYFTTEAAARAAGYGPAANCKILTP